MNYSQSRVVFQEIPDETSLAILVNGCPLRCNGCHSAASWKGLGGDPLNRESLAQLIENVSEWITCVLFLGGEWESEVLCDLLEFCRSRGLKTALYTGLDDVEDAIRKRLDYLKTGPYIAAQGGLDSPNTNQILINLKNQEILNYKFLSQQ